jgi:hypothetical protein
MVAQGGESPTRKANARRHVAHAAVLRKQKKPKKCSNNVNKNQEFLTLQNKNRLTKYD